MNRYRWANIAAGAICAADTLVFWGHPIPMFICAAAATLNLAIAVRR